MIIIKPKYSIKYCRIWSILAKQAIWEIGSYLLCLFVSLFTFSKLHFVSNLGNTNLLVFLSRRKVEWLCLQIKNWISFQLTRFAKVDVSEKPNFILFPAWFLWRCVCKFMTPAVVFSLIIAFSANAFSNTKMPNWSDLSFS